MRKPMPVTTTENIHAYPSMRSAKRTCGIHSKSTRTTAPDATVAYMLHARTSAARATALASHADVLRAFAGSNMATALPANGKATRTSDKAPSIIDGALAQPWNLAQGYD